MTRRVPALLATVIAAHVLTPAAQAAAAGAPTANGCAAGYSYVSVADVVAAGYARAWRVDDPTSGLLSRQRPGNGDGYLCTLALGHRVNSSGLQLLDIEDNNLPTLAS